MSEHADLRYSLTLCQEEKQFIDKRKRQIHKAMKTHFGFGAPKNYKEVPVIGIIGSGGGFRAMVAYSGVMSALSELGILDMTTYIGGLSGSAWYLSQLYSHSKWPGLSPSEQRIELRNNIDHSFLWLFKSKGITFVKEVWKKRSRGEPVSFTDLFGHLVGNTLLKDRLDSKLSDQRQAVSDGLSPLPLYTCLHVKNSVSAMVFHEWMEFSPYEIGLPKYGTFLKTEQFSCKFFMGCIVKEFPEPPLHFLQGIWGSAFCIQFKRLLQDDKHVDPVELMRREREELVEELKKDLESCDIQESESSEDENVYEKGTHGEKTTGGLQRKRSKSTKLKQKTFWDSMLSRMMETRWFQSIELRAAQIFNFMRGLSLNNVFPFSPFTKTQEEENENNKCDTFGGIFDLHPTHVKKLYVVDSGLTFNSPYPVLLRPQREVDIILSFDFSARASDDTPPFKELLLAAKWAELNKVPFPPIDTSVLEKEGLKECYVFKHPWDPNCPIVLHFCLVNINFKRELRPGIERTTQEELDFANFSIFDDPARPYSTFKFTYTHLEFDRLSQLMEYNTLLCQDLILDNIATCIKRRRRFSIRRPCKKKDIARLSLNSKIKADKLAEYIAMVEQVSGLSENDDLDKVIKKDENLDKNDADFITEIRDSNEYKQRPFSLPLILPEDVTSNGNKEPSRRMRLTSDMTRVDEENDDPDSSPTKDYTTGSGLGRVTLTRSKAVKSPMKPKTFKQNVKSIIQSNDNTQLGDNEVLLSESVLPQKLSPKSLRKTVSYNTTSSVSNMKTLENADSACTEKEELKNECDNDPNKSNQTEICNSAANITNQPLVDWIDLAERVTHL
ncbi:cytosolic phospholipase A2-like isoform X4 [Biomphalaria glabrata]|uniref:Cytosolic phospholipase A2-like isoform X4 n=1 Tax=Biomphalaria glabrata TaxID=6526 RepID=A0A9W3BFN5_BIOGL|nr:cytosolic phospholipase A2-like isoform X4 [Biomphalaria glabrata]